MSCPDVKKIELYINGKLSEDKKAKLDAHFAECVYCRSQLEDIRKNETLLPQIKSLLIEPNGLTIEQAQSFLPKRYHIVMKVSHGGSGQVFKASESPIGRWVAIKFLPKEVGLNEDRWREARLMGDLKHPNIATIYLPEEKDGIRFFVMEWIDGRPLVDACAAMPLIKKLELFLKVLDAIAIAHEKNIIHRDIKPSNILLDSNLEPKILDFGISVERHRMAAVNSNIFVGSPPHSAPEQIPPVGNITLATDVFSLGILLYQLMTDELPFFQTTIHELFEAIKHATPKPPRSITPKIPEELERICLKALEKNPKKRYIDAKKFAESIRNYLANKDVRQGSTVLNDFKNSVADSFYISRPDSAIFDLPIKENHLLADRYRILGEIGKKICTVYRAYDSDSKMEVAIKVLVVNNENAEDYLEQLHREVSVRNKINDFAHVIKSADIHQANFEGLKLAILPMEYANGGNFRKWLSEHQDIESRVSKGVDLFIQACLGVQAIHAHLIVHKDIKPESFLLCMNGEQVTVKLTDFGKSQTPEDILNESVPSYSVSDDTLCHTSPEQIRNERPKDIKPTSDIYSLGIILFEIVDGNLPFQGTQEQLKDQHLNKIPPRLKKDLKPWQQIIDRCLAKEPEKRYSKIEYLIKDLDNLKRGWALSVNIACSNCSHINIDPQKIDCEECHQHLSKDFFRPCPRCTRDVRLDQENCPFCLQHGVAAHYLLKERMEKIEMLKDEDPVCAIELLDLVFKDGAGEYAKRAEELIADLNQKQKRIVLLISNASELIQKGEIENAIKSLKKIIEMIPRHRFALEKKNELQAIVDNLTLQTQKAINLMDTAEFSEAEKVLQKCLELAPNRKNIREMLDQCSRRASDFKKTYNHACSFLEKKLINSANDQIKKALKDAFKSQKAKSLSKELNSIIEKTDDFIKKLNHQIRWAQFENAGKTISSIETLQADNKKIESLKQKFRETRNLYTAAITDVGLAIELHDLSKASDNINKALELCPDSTEAKVLSDKIEIEKHTFEKLLCKAAVLVKEAKFGEAENTMDKAKAIWITADELVRKRKLLNDTRTKYNLHFTNALEAKKKTELDVAEKAVELALSTCPNAAESQSISELIKREKQKVGNLLNKIDALVKEAKFEDVENVLDKAKAIWVTADGLGGKRTLLNGVRVKYSLHFTNALEAKEKTELDVAEKEIKLALSACPDSAEAKSISGLIEDGKRKANEVLKKLDSFVKLADFSGAENVLNQAENIWKTIRDLDKKRASLKEVQDDYNLHLKTAIACKDTGELDIAVKETNAALLKCPNSGDAEDMLTAINKLKIKTKEYINQARELIPEAKFDQAIEQIELGKGLWKTCLDTTVVEEEINTTKNKYIEQILTAKKQLSNNLFEQASYSCNEALKICPRSNEVIVLSTKISSESYRHQRREEMIHSIFVTPPKVILRTICAIFTFLFLDHAKVTFIMLGILIGLAAVVFGVIALFSLSGNALAGILVLIFLAVGFIWGINNSNKA